jgi:hypothetical protein
MLGCLCLPYCDRSCMALERLDRLTEIRADHAWLWSGWEMDIHKGEEMDKPTTVQSNFSSVFLRSLGAFVHAAAAAAVAATRDPHMNRRLPRRGAIRNPWSALQRSLQNAQARHSLDDPM